MFPIYFFVGLGSWLVFKDLGDDCQPPKASRMIPATSRGLVTVESCHFNGDKIDWVVLPRHQKIVSQANVPSTFQRSRRRIVWGWELYFCLRNDASVLDSRGDQDFKSLQPG